MFRNTNLLTVTPLRALITILRQWMHLLIGDCLMMFGTSTFLLRFLCSFGDFFAIGCLPKIT